MVRTRQISRSAGFVLMAASVFISSLVFAEGPTRHTVPSNTTPPLDLALTKLPRPKPLAPFSLFDQHGQPFTLGELRDRWTFVFFGYTSCPDICPTTLSMLSAVKTNLEKLPIEASDVGFVFVTVDPQRDTPAHLARYLEYFDRQMIGVTGHPEQIALLAEQLWVVFKRRSAAAASEDYWFDHSSAILLIDPRAQLTGLFSAPHDPEAIAEAFVAIRSQTRE
jgi:protein SCO1/2